MLWFEQANYISVNLGLIAYGIHIVSFVMCVYYLIMEKAGKKNLKWLALAVVIFGCGTANISVNMTFNQWAWVDYRAFPGGPLMFLLQEQSHPINVKGNGVSIVIGFLTDALLIYRVYVVYQKYYVIVVPILAWLAATVLGGFWDAQIAVPESSFWAGKTQNFALPYFALAMGLNILLTGLLVTRLMYMRHKINSALGSSRHGDTYSNVAAMILESAIPYGIVSFIFLVLYSMQNTAALLFIPLLVQVQCISPIVIIMRVARGRTWSNHTISESNLSRIRMASKGSGPVKLSSVTALNSSSHEMSVGSFKARQGGLDSFSKDMEAV